MPSNSLNTKTIPDLSLRFAAATYEKKDGTDEAEVLEILEELRNRGETAKGEFEQTLIAMAKTNGESGRSFFEKLSGGKSEKGFVARVLADEMKGLWVQAEYRHAMFLWDPDPINITFHDMPGDFESLAEGLLNSVAQMGESSLQHPLLSGALISMGVGVALASGGKLAAVGAGAKLAHSLPRVLRALEIFGNLAGITFTGLAAEKVYMAGKRYDQLVRSVALRQAGEHFGNALLSFSLGSPKAKIKSPAEDFQALLKNLGRGAPKEDLQSLAILIRSAYHNMAAEDHQAIAKALSRLEPSDLLSLDQEALWNFLIKYSRPTELNTILSLKIILHSQEQDKGALIATKFTNLIYLDPTAQAEVVDAIFSALTSLKPEDEARGLILISEKIQHMPKIMGQMVRWENFARPLEKIFNDSARNSDVYTKLLLNIAERAPRGQRHLFKNLWSLSHSGKRDRLIGHLIEWDKKNPEEMMATFLQKSRENRQDEIPYIQDPAFWEAMELSIQEGALDKLEPLSSKKIAELIDHLMDQPMLAIAKGSFPEILYRRAMVRLLEKLDPGAQEALYGATELLRLLNPHNRSTERLHQELSGLLSLRNSGIGKIEVLSKDSVRIQEIHPVNISGPRIWAALPDSVQFVSYETSNGVYTKRGHLTRLWDPSWLNIEDPLMISIHMKRDQTSTLNPPMMVVDIGFHNSQGRLLDYECIEVTDIPVGAEEILLRSLVENFQQQLKEQPTGTIGTAAFVYWLKEQLQTKEMKDLCAIKATKP